MFDLLKKGVLLGLGAVTLTKEKAEALAKLEVMWYKQPNSPKYRILHQTK